MSISTEITRLQGAKSDIRDSIIAKGVDVPSAETLDNYSGYIDQISGGGGTTDPMLDEYAFLEVVHKASSSVYLGVNWAKGYYSNPLAQSKRSFRLYYSLDNKQTWNYTNISANGMGIITLPAEGEKIYFKASHDASSTCWGANDVPAYFYLQRVGGSTGDLTVKAGGNVLSLSWGDDFKGKTTWKNTCYHSSTCAPAYCLNGLFSYNGHGEMLVGIDDLRLPLDIGEYVYGNIFRNNTGLTGVLDFRKIFFGNISCITTSSPNSGMLRRLQGSPTIILPEIGTVGSGRMTSQWTSSNPANISYFLYSYIFSGGYVKNVWVKYIDPSYTGTLELGLSASSGTIHTTSDSKITIPTGWTRVNDYDTNIPALVY